MSQPDIGVWITVDGCAPLIYRLCSVCQTLQVNINKTRPAVCADCAKVEGKR